MVDPSTVALLSFAFSAGSATFFAPCAFPLLPGYLAYFLGDTARGVASDGGVGTGSRAGAGSGGPARGLVARLRRPAARALVFGVVASAGITLVYLGLAGVTAALGAGALADVAVLELVVGAVFVVAGTAMAAGVKITRQVVRLPRRRASLAGFFLFGVLYAGAAAGCTAPLFLAVVVRGVTLGPLLGAGVALAYATGMSAVLVGVTGVVALGGSSLLSTLRSNVEWVYRGAGALLALSELAEVYYYFYGFPEVVPL